MFKFDEITMSILTRFFFAYHIKCKGVEKKDVYCGITDDLERRKAEHNVDDFVCTYKCDSFSIAQEVERKLHDQGFNTGNQLGNGTKDSVYAYMYIIGPSTKE